MRRSTASQKTGREIHLERKAGIRSEEEQSFRNQAEIHTQRGVRNPEPRVQ